MPHGSAGTGSFGRVRLVRCNATGQYLALKAIKKADILRMHQVQHIANEKDILASLRHPFIVDLCARDRPRTGCTPCACAAHHALHSSCRDDCPASGLRSLCCMPPPPLCRSLLQLRGCGLPAAVQARGVQRRGARVHADGLRARRRAVQPPAGVREACSPPSSHARVHPTHAVARAV